MTALIASSVLRTCLGDGAQTYTALLAGHCGVGPLRRGEPKRLKVAYGYHIDEEAAPFAPSRWLASCVRAAIAASGVDPRHERVACVVGTGLGEFSTFENMEIPAHKLHFAGAVHHAVPGIREVLTIANACSASGHALAMAQDMVELGDADAVVVAGTDAMTESMLAMIGRVVDAPTDRVRPFDAQRQGVLLGEGAAAVVVTPDDGRAHALGRLVATGLSCDAHHETAPATEGIVRAMRDALARAALPAEGVGCVIAHGTGTALNDPAECAAMAEVLGQPLVTAIKGAVGHLSGAAALANVDVALRCLDSGWVPPVVGLREPLAEARHLRLARDVPVPLPPGAVQVNAFGFGGVNSVTLLVPA